MKIYTFISTQIISGAEIVLKDYIHNSKLQFVIITPHVDEVISFFKSENNVEILSFETCIIKKNKNMVFSRMRNIYGMVSQARSISRIIKEKKIPFLYVNNTLAVSIIGIACHYFGISSKVVAHIHDMMSTSTFRPFIKYLCHDFTFISVSERCKKEMIILCKIDESNIHTIYNGIDVCPTIPKNNKTFTIGFAGSITERKGLIYLANAYRTLIDEKEDISLNIAYNFVDKDYWERVKKILFHYQYSVDTYPHDQMIDFYRKIDLLVVPSLRDPLPTTVLEAMNYGVLVIGSEIDGLKEMLSKDNLFKPSDLSEIKAHLRRFIHMSQFERNEIINNNHKTIERCFDIRVTSRKKDMVLLNNYEG